MSVSIHSYSVRTVSENTGTGGAQSETATVTAIGVAGGLIALLVLALSVVSIVYILLKYKKQRLVDLRWAIVSVVHMN